MRLRILGSSGTYPGVDCPSSGYVVEHDGVKIWIDAGTGTFAQVQRFYGHTQIDALILTHIHSDHCLDVFPLYYCRRFDPDAAPLPLYCPPGTLDRLGRLLAGDGSCTLDMIFEFHEVTPDDVVQIGDLRCTFRSTQHPIPTHAIRIETPDATLTFTADTGPDHDLGDFAAGSDMLLSEATFQNDSIGPPLHLSAAQAAELALDAGVRSLVLTHILPDSDRAISIAQAREIAGDLPVFAAAPGEIYDVGGNALLEEDSKK